MKFLLTLTFLLFTLSFVFVGTKAFQCYQCGDQDGVVEDDFKHPCPKQWLTDDTKYIVDCHPVGTNKKYKCKYEQYRLTHHSSRVTNEYTHRDCVEIDEKYEKSDDTFCHERDCSCFTSLCNGLEMDASIKNGKDPFNPYKTTTTTTTSLPETSSTSGKKSQKDDASTATVILFQVILLAYKFY